LIINIKYSLKLIFVNDPIGNKLKTNVRANTRGKQMDNLETLETWDTKAHRTKKKNQKKITWSLPRKRAFSLKEVINFPS
jgi:hypothetical protein